MGSTMGNTASIIFASAQPPFPSRGEWGASPAHNLFMNNANSIFYYHLDKGTNHQRQKHHLYLPSRGQVHLHREPNMKLLPARKACGKVENLHATDLQRSSGDYFGRSRASVEEYERARRRDMEVARASPPRPSKAGVAFAAEEQSETEET